MKTLWSITEPGLSARDVANRFAATYFDQPLKVEEIHGERNGDCFHGRFRIADGTRCYTLTYHTDGLWSVSVEEEGESPC